MLNRHLRTDCKRDAKKWYSAFQSSSGTKRKQPKVIDEQHLLLAKYFISSNTSLCELANPFLKKLLGNALKLPGVFSFRNTVLPSLMNSLYTLLGARLNEAESICLIVDIWTNNVNSDFIGLAAVITDPKLSRELHVIDMMRMPGPHSAEVIKFSIEHMVNKYDFDKSKIKGLQALTKSTFSYVWF